MGVRCGKCGNTHSDSETVRACHEQTETDMRFIRRKTQTKLHPLNEAAFERYAANVRRRQKEPTRDDSRNLAGVRAARAALQHRVPTGSA